MGPTLRRFAKSAADLGITVGSLHPTVNLGNGRPPAVCSADVWVRRRAIGALREAANLLGEVGASRLVLRFLDDTRYPGRDEFEARKVRLFEALSEVCAHLPAGATLAVDYHVARPCGYAGAPDWRTLRDICVAADDRARVLIDTTVDEHYGRPLVELVRAGQLGGVIIGGLPDDPFQLFCALVDIAGTMSLRANATSANAHHAPLMLDATTWSTSAQRGTGVAGLIDLLCAVQEYAVRAELLDVAHLARLGEADAAQFIAEAYLAATEPGTEFATALARARTTLGVTADPRVAFNRTCQTRFVTTERASVAERLAEATPRPDPCHTRPDDILLF